MCVLMCLVGLLAALVLMASAVAAAPEPHVHATLFATNLPNRGVQAAEELEIALKSLFINARCPLDLTFVTAGEQDHAVLREMLAPLVAPRNTLRYAFLDLQDELRDAVKRKLAEWRLSANTSHHSARKEHDGVAVMAKFFLPALLPHVNQTLLLDTDIVVGADVCALWNQFEAFGPDTLAAFAPANATYDVFNTGVGLLNLERMRRRGWTLGAGAAGTGMETGAVAGSAQGAGHVGSGVSGSISSARTDGPGDIGGGGAAPAGGGDAPPAGAGAGAGGAGGAIDFGGAMARLRKRMEEGWGGRVLPTADQNLYNAVYRRLRAEQPNAYRALPVSWNLAGCESFHGVRPGPLRAAAFRHGKTPQPPPGQAPPDEHGLFFGIAHFNCRSRSDAEAAWGVVLRYYREYRWEWLNEARTERSAFEVLGF